METEPLTLAVVRVVEAAAKPLQEYEIRAAIPECPKRIHFTLRSLVRRGILRVNRLKLFPDRPWSRKTRNTYEVIHDGSK